MPTSFTVVGRANAPRGPRWSQDARAHHANDQLDGELCGRVHAVEGRIDLDDLNRGEHAGLGEELHGEVRLPVRQAPADRRTDAGRDLRVADVDVQRQVNEPWP